MSKRLGLELSSNGEVLNGLGVSLTCLRLTQRSSDVTQFKNLQFFEKNNIWKNDFVSKLLKGLFRCETTLPLAFEGLKNKTSNDIIAGNGICRVHFCINILRCCFFRSLMSIPF